ncbi:hypothetical protein HCN44_005607 [Aphidius gifuensis]|uniref:RecQ-mediated genome instability protein 1 n=1 Tax=Aphidius gifuensis TaxID=684658 RepID=A0A834Y3E8_APHGI|nr:hypothetical protein HCN44_005607 [Aphidius gifuensis]
MNFKVEKYKKILKSRHYEMNDHWLSDCVSYYLTHDNTNASDNETITFITTQFSLSDLREICNEKGCLPKNLGQMTCTTLPGNYILQMEKAYDISTSKYKQLEQIRKISNANIEITESEQTQPWEPKSNRMMQLFLTDGVQDVIAIEHKSIRTLKENILPGFKVIIKGPVTCRRGVIMLEESNFELLAGEVDSLLIKNAPENVFAHKVDELFAEDFEIDDDELTLIESSQNHQKNNTKITKPVLSKNNQAIQKMMTPVGARKSEAFNELPVLFDPVVVEDEVIDFPDDDDDEIMAMAMSTNEYTSMNNNSNSNSEKVDRLSQSTSNLALSVDKNNSTNNSTTSKSVETKSIKDNKNNQNAELEIFDDMDFDFDDDLLTQKALEESLKKFSDNNKQNNNSTNAPSTSSSTSTSAKKSTVNYLNNKNYKVASGSWSPTTKLKPPVAKTTPKPPPNKKITDFLKKPEPVKRMCDFICEIEKTNWTNDTVRKKIHGRVKRLRGLTKNHLEWKLDLIVKDGTGHLDVTVDPELMKSIIGMSVSDFKKMKKMKSDPTVEQKLRQQLSEAENKILVLDAFLDIDFFPNRTPAIVKITDMTDQERRNVLLTMRQLGYHKPQIN